MKRINDIINAKKAAKLKQNNHLLHNAIMSQRAGPVKQAFELVQIACSFLLLASHCDTERHRLSRHEETFALASAEQSQVGTRLLLKGTLGASKAKKGKQSIARASLLSTLILTPAEAPDEENEDLMMIDQKGMRYGCTYAHMSPSGNSQKGSSIWAP
eukprot:scaffold297976_cov19-Tisochrysis_lutea.AAC.1